MSNIIYKTIEDQTIVWFKASNNYVIIPTATAEIIDFFDQNYTAKQISQKLSETLKIPTIELLTPILKIQKEVFIPNTTINNTKPNNILFDSNTKTEITRFYKINKTIFKIDFQSEVEAFLVHPKFEHLTIDPSKKFEQHFKVLFQNNHLVLYVNDNFIGSWKKENTHYFQGKFSMEITQAIHQKKEEDWLGVFHASAISKGNNSMLFLGDSGNGKSTSLALLQANGFTCIADDFVPVDANKQEVYSFPSAISIKKKGVPVLIDLYPELATTAEYHLKSLNKIVRYLPPNTTNFSKHLNCKGFVFIKYSPNTNLEIKEISNIEAFKQLVPDSWLSPIQKNAELFLNWFLQLPCYQLTYSNNQKMITTVNQLFDNEL